MWSIEPQLQKNVSALQALFHNSSDFYTKNVEIAGVQCCLCVFEGLCSLEKLWIMMLDALYTAPQQCTGEEVFDFIVHKSCLPVESTPVQTADEVCAQLTAGAAVVLIDGVAKGIVVSAQNMQFRSVQEPDGEGNVRGSREGFVELLRVNVSLVRRLIRTDALCTQIMQVNGKTATEVALLYDPSAAPAALVNHIQHTLQTAQMPLLLDSSYLVPTLRGGHFSLFNEVGYTERPAKAAAKICEGKIVLLVNGSPFAMILPFAFTDNFVSMDDYASKAYFATLMRVIKYFSFCVAVLLPGLFVAVAGWAPQMLPPQLLYKVAAAEAATPLPLFLEALAVDFLLEIIREAGLRLPKAIGHSVSLVAALLVGDAAIKAGLLGTPVVVTAAFTAICAYTVPSLYEPVMVLRLLFILAGGVAGLWGVLLLSVLAVLDIVCVRTFHTEYAKPLVPLQNSFFQDGLVRLPKYRK